MKSKTISRSLQILVAGGLLAGLAFAFQNCTGGFSAKSMVSTSLSSTEVSLSRSLDARGVAAILPVEGYNAGAGIYVPPGGSAVGVNTMLVSHTIFKKYGYCDKCPSWIGGMTFNEAEESLNMLTGTSLNHYREIIEAKTFFPTEGQIAHLDDLVELLKIYQRQRAHVMLSLGTPLAPWMNPEMKGAVSYQPNTTRPELHEGGRVCFLPKSDAAWSVVKNNLSWAFGRLMKALWEDPRLDKQWMQTNLMIDPMNEFDSFVAGPDCIMSEGPLYATGKRAADFSGGIQWVLNEFNLPFIVTMPSGVTGNLQYYADFYIHGGKGMANVHYYYSNPSVSPTDPRYASMNAQVMVEGLKKIRDVVPEPYKNHIILGEFGAINTLNPPYCTVENAATSQCAGRLLAGEALQQYLHEVFSNEELKALAPIRLYWDLNDSRAAAHTRSVDLPYLNFGLIYGDVVPKSSLYYYLFRNEGVDLTTDKIRMAGLRERIKKAVDTQNSKISDASISSFIRQLIYRTQTWDQLVAFYKPSAPQTPSNPSQLPASTTSLVDMKISEHYMSLFGRMPDAAGLNYWKSVFTSNGVTPKTEYPMSCWKNQIIKGIKGVDCQFYMNKFAPRDSHGNQVGWVPSAQCPLPNIDMTGASRLPQCAVYPDDASTPCPGSGGMPAPTQSQKNLCIAYSDLFGRAPDSGGYAYWLAEIGTKSVVCMKKTLAPGIANTSDCKAFKQLHGVDAPSAFCGGSPRDFGCQPVTNAVGSPVPG